MKSARPNFHERAPLLWLVVPFAAGIALADLLRWDDTPWVWAVVVGAALSAIWVDPTRRMLWVGLAMIAAGGLHYQAHRQSLPEWEHLPDREIEFVIQIERVFGEILPGEGISFIGALQWANDPRNELTGQRIHVQLRGSREGAVDYGRGATLRLVGSISRLDPDSATGFVQYLEDSGLNFRVKQARWLETVAPPTRYAIVRGRVKQRAGQVLSAGLENDRPELAGALRAMLLGERHALTGEAKSLFMRSGTMHLFAISGLHIGVIAGALYTLLRLTRLPMRGCIVVGTLLLWFYVDLIGQTPSAVRAWLMISCYQLAKGVRAPGNPLAAIATSALLVLLLDPMQLFSAGFQMSYAVVFALLIHGLPLADHWVGLVRPWRDLPPATMNRWQRVWIVIVAAVVHAAAFTWTASLIGLITSVAFFGWLTPLAFYANVLLVPLAGLVVAGGFAAIVVGLLGFSSIALLFNHAAAVLLVVMRTALEWGLGNAGSVPAAFFSTHWGPAGVVVVLGSMVVARDILPPENRWRWWLPSLVSLLVLVIGLRIP